MSFFSSRIREVEHQSISACIFQDIQISADVTSPQGEWKIIHDNDSANQNIQTSMDISGPDQVTSSSTTTTRILPGKGLASGTTVRIAPMDRKCGGWDPEHFHTDFHPSPNNSFLVTFEASARECVALALSPDANFSMGKTYAIHIGAGGNLTTVLRRWLPSGEECVEATFSTIRICADFVFKSYWVLFHSGKLYVGTGKIPGRQCVAMLDDTLYDQLRPGQDKVKYIGFGNSSLHRHARDLKVRKIVVTDIPNTLDTSKLNPDPTHNLSEFSSNTTNPNSSGDYSQGQANSQSSMTGTNQYDRELLQQYHEECVKAQFRASKFNTPMDSEPPGPDAFLKWSEARRLRANPEPGFITGIDVTSEEELNKRKKRKERFEQDKRKRKLQMSAEGGGGTGDGESMDMDEKGDGENDLENGNQEEVIDSEKGLTPILQAWDNIDFIREYRIDPPLNVHGSETSAEPVPEKIHLFAIDWAAFKQMRSDDIMAYFSIYGPSYVEWLSELSCNVMFQDKFSAIRAMQAMSQEIPSPPPINDDENEMETNTNEMDESNTNNKDSIVNEPTEKTELEDLGSMGWRFCNKLLVKAQNDRFGRKGTKSRLLMRVATTLDILEHRPTDAPAPPPGFTTKAVLGPGSDFPPPQRRRRRGKKKDKEIEYEDRNRRGGGGQRRAKRRRRNRNRDWGGDNENNMDNVMDALDQGLKAKR